MAVTHGLVKTQDDVENPRSGGMLMERLAQCHCGSLRAITSGVPLSVAICHCKACQRRTGALAASVAGFAKAQVTIEGHAKVFDRYGQSGRKVRFYFCPNCGTSLYWEADARPDTYILAVGTFADPNFPPPSVSIFEESKHTWMQLPHGMKHFQGAIIASS
jgi:hypothetical protein